MCSLQSNVSKHSPFSSEESTEARWLDVPYAVFSESTLLNSFPGPQDGVGTARPVDSEEYSWHPAVKSPASSRQSCVRWQ